VFDGMYWQTNEAKRAYRHLLEEKKKKRYERKKFDNINGNTFSYHFLNTGNEVMWFSSIK
jgi:hypothetical protein